MVYVTEVHWRVFCASNNIAVSLVGSLSDLKSMDDPSVLWLTGQSDPILGSDPKTCLSKLVSRFPGKVVLACCNGATQEINSWNIPRVVAHDYNADGLLSDFVKEIVK